MKKDLARLLGVMALLSLYGCHTMEGLGSDIQEAGGALEHSATECHGNAVECHGRPVECHENPDKCHDHHNVEYCPYCAKPIGKDRRVR